MRKFFITLLLLFFCMFSYAQNGITQCGTDTGQEPFPIDSYKELPDHNKPIQNEWKNISGTAVSWGSTNKRYQKHKVPFIQTKKHIELTAWKGESINAQAVIWSAVGCDSVTYKLSNLKNGKNIIPASCAEIGFVRYVMTDEVNKDGKGACGFRPDHTIFDSSLVADVIDSKLLALNLKPMSANGIWIKLNVPTNVASGNYTGNLKVFFNGHSKNLSISLKVINRTLPLPKNWKFHLDLWQNPFAVARYYNVPLWSDAHLEAMKPIMERLAKAGQKVITASIMHHPWDGQTEDAFESMVTWIKRLDGSWFFDFAVFDRWVEFMMSCGINKQINCYSMIPWMLSFQYFDQATNSMQVIKCKPGEDAFNNMWGSMLSAFAKHLKEKGWFDICTIAMDERSMEDMLQTFNVIFKADSNFKVSLAGNYHKEIEENLYDYCITIAQKFPDNILNKRKAEGKKSTYYTCCTEVYPNTFTFSEPIEAEWLGYFCAAANVDGYLRWAYNSWVKEPLLDSRFRAWAGGDTYLVYPGNRSSIRFEKLLEGIQAHEKIRILKDEFIGKKKTDKINVLENILQPFNLQNIKKENFINDINKVKKILNTF